MHRDEALTRVRSVTVGLAGMSVLGVAAVAGLAHDATAAHRQATQPSQDLHSTPGATVGSEDDKPTPQPRPTKAPITKAPAATSGGS